MKKHSNSASRRQEMESGFAAFQITGAFAFSQLLEYPYNILMVIIPFLAFEGVFIVFYLRKLNRKNQTIKLGLKETSTLPGVMAKPKPKGIPVTKAEITNYTVNFSVAKGLLKKRLVTVKEIPVAEITAVEGLHNELTVTWKGAADSFVLQKKGESFGKLRDQIQGLIDEQQKTRENNAKAALRRSDLAQVIEGSMGVVDLSFDMLMALQVKKVNWEGLEAYVNDLGQNFAFAGQTMAPFSLDFSKVSEAIKNQVPEKVSQETFNLLQSIYGYFDELNLEEDLQTAHPNFSDAKAVISAYYTLNDLLLGKIVGEKNNKKESQVLEVALQNLANETNFKVNFEDLLDSFTKMGSDFDVESVIWDSREIFKEQLKNIDRPNEQLSTAQPPTEQATAQPEPLPPPTPQEPASPSEPQAPEQPQTLEPIVEPQQAMQEPIEPTAIEQTEPELPPKPQEPIQLAEPQELTVEPSTEPSMVEQPEAVQPSTEQTEPPSVQQQEPAQAEVALPKIEDTKNTSEPPPKKKSAGRRLRKSILGY